MSGSVFVATAEGQRTTKAKKGLDRVPAPILITLSVVVIIAIWQLVVSTGLMSAYVLPSPWDTATAFYELMVSLVTGGYIWDNFVITMTETLLGLLLAAAIGFLLGVVISETVIGRKVVQPIMVAIYAAPKVALAPLFVAWFGFGLLPKVVMAATIAFFPVMVGTAAGLAQIDEDEDKLFTMSRASRWQRFWKLKLPNSLPFIFAGLQTAAVLSIIGAIVAEYIGGGRGLGVLVDSASSNFALDRVFALVLLLSIAAYVIFISISLIERKVVYWRTVDNMPGKI